MPSSSDFLVYYGHAPEALERLCGSELVIFESRGWKPEQLRRLKESEAQLYAYLSPFAWPDWMGAVKWWWGSKERDPIWNAWWLKPSSRGWRYQLKKMCGDLAPRFDGLFLDNLDRLEQDPKSLQPFLRFLEKLRQQWPQMKLIGNRGFSHWSSLNKKFDGVLFENLTDRAFTSKDRAWVEEKLYSLQSTKIYALDYQTRRVEQEAQRLRKLFPRLRYYCAPDESLQSLSSD